MMQMKMIIEAVDSTRVYGFSIVEGNVRYVHQVCKTIVIKCFCCFCHMYTSES